MRELVLTCPYCETVMVRCREARAEEASWYECPICGHRVDPSGLRSLDDEMPSQLHAQ
jgi:transcription elongation factor Elf1